MTETRTLEGTSEPRETTRGRFQLFTSLKAEMMLSLAVLGTAALSLAAFNVVVLDELVMSPNGALYLALLIIGDVIIFVGFGVYKVQGLVIDPLETVVETTEAIAAGDLSRRVPAGTTVEFKRLARSVNRMTRRLLEEQAQRSHLEKVASVGRLAAGVAHEIGNPLGAISGYAHILRRAAAGSQDAADALSGIERESARIDRIVRGMLEYARPRRRSSVLIDLNATVRRAVDLLRDQGTLRDVTVRLSLQENMPRLNGDCHEMEQVLVNLLLNAVDALEGWGNIRVVTQCVTFAELCGGTSRRAGDPHGFAIAREQSARVRAWSNTVGEPKEIVKLVVADNGPGIPPSDAERVFDPFFTTKEPGRGTGLGLAIVARVVESLGGTVWVHQAREGGAALTMYFPVRGSVGEGASGS